MASVARERPRGTRFALWLLMVPLVLAGCSESFLLTAGAKRLTAIKLDRGPADAPPVRVNAAYSAPPGPPVLPSPSPPGADSKSSEVLWALGLDDALEVLGPLEPTYGELLAHPSVESRHRSRENGQLPQVYGISQTHVWNSSSCAPPSATGANGAPQFECVHLPPAPEAENPDDDSYFALAEYRATTLDRQTAPLGDSGVSVQVFYEFCAEHLSESVHPIGRKFSAYDLVLCGERLSFVGTQPLDARERVLTWLIRRYKISPGMPFTVPASDTPGAAARFSVPAPAPAALEQYRWCGPNQGIEMYTPCSATVTFAFDPTTGYGVVLIMTPEVYQYLYTRRYFTFTNLPLPRKLAGPNRYLALLFADPEHYASGSGAFLCERCGPESFPLPPKLRKQLTPDPP